MQNSDQHTTKGNFPNCAVLSFLHSNHLSLSECAADCPAHAGVELSMIARLAAHAWKLLALALAGLLLWQTLRLAAAELAEAKAQQALATHTAAQAQATQAETTKKAGALLEHAGTQQENTHAYTEDLQRLEAVRIAGLQHEIRAAATRNAQLAANAAACRDLADRHEQLAARAAEGAGVVGELVGLVEIRDAQVKALKGQIAADGVLIGRP